MQADAKNQIMSWDGFMELSEHVSDEKVDSRISSIRPNHLCEIVFEPSESGMHGVMLSHRNVTWTADAAARAISLEKTDVLISSMPLA